ncbi:hypothetical protein GWK47_054805 [Chionoecetes opilio]|uniref:HAT C-terminal dimerisation domain-containing protein n=1 Tax=Chionoecetes opilio TaxID=41210 RepID=A0A8J4Y5S1_CHIOP|nr:hypothetical protein GWK47_054805 [Chionoecetes opilio]
MDWVLDKVVDQSDCGSSLGNTKITDLVFADDAVFFAESMEVLVMALEALHEEVKYLGLEVSWLKTKVQVFGGLLDETVQSVHACGEDIEILESSIHPLFKLLVVLILNPEKVEAVISRLLFEVTEQAVLDTSDGSSPDEDEEDDFFKALMSPGTTATEGYNSTRPSNKMGKELESWCSEKQRNKLLEQAMFPAPSHPTWVDVFVKYNTVIPSSAAVERLFSQGSDIMKATRASLTSDNFEILVFMKGNIDLFNMELSPEDSE